MLTLTVAASAASGAGLDSETFVACSNETLGKSCFLNEARSLKGICRWEEGFVEPSCAPVSECSTRDLGLSCMVEGSTGNWLIGTCSWPQNFAAPTCSLDW